MRKTITLLLLTFSFGLTFSQYKQEEYQKYPEQKIFPKQKFDLAAAKSALSYGTTTVTGRAFAREKNQYGFKAGNRIFADHMTVELFPFTPYFEEWYNLKKKEENIKKNKFVFMDTDAYKYRLTCETNARGEFTFPKMKPGKYIIVGNLNWSKTGSYNEYTGSGYNSYGRIDYYDKKYYTEKYNDFLMQIIEVKPGETETKVKLK